MIKYVKTLINPRIMGIVGTMGSGKTLFASALALKLKDNYTILANYNLDCADYKVEPNNIIDFMEQLKYLNGKKLLIIDEFHIFSDSRLSSSNFNILMSYFITQTRKQDIQLLYTTQHFGQVDKRVRDNTDIIALPKYDITNDLMTVKMFSRGSFGSDYQLKLVKRFNKLRPVFGTYDSDELIGANRIDELNRKIKKSQEKL